MGLTSGVDVEELRADNDELRRQNAELEAKANSEGNDSCKGEKTRFCAMQMI